MSYYHFEINKVGFSFVYPVIHIFLFSDIIYVCMDNLVIHTPLSCFIQDKNFFFFLVIFKWQLNEHTMYVFAFIVCHRVTTMWGGHCNTIALSYFKWLFDFCYQWIYVQKCYQNLVIALAAVFCDRSPRMHPLGDQKRVSKPDF